MSQFSADLKAVPPGNSLSTVSNQITNQGKAFLAEQCQAKFCIFLSNE